MQTKRELIMNTPEMRELLHSDKADLVGDDSSIVVDSQEYVGMGCDLRNLRRLERLLKSVVDVQKSLVLCITEDSTAYMSVDAADALISWSATLSNGKSSLV